MAEPTPIKPPKFEIFRAHDAVDYGPDRPMTAHALTEAEAAGFARMSEAGFIEGSRLKLLYSRPGLSLTYVWFKSGYPLPRHSHSADCLYFIVAGSLTIGTETLGSGDGFFVGCDVPYAYLPGEDGVEVLEIRTSDAFDFRMLADSAAYWDKALASLLSAKLRWTDQTSPPSGLIVGRDNGEALKQ